MNPTMKKMMIFAFIATITSVGMTEQHAFASVGVPFASPTGGLFNSAQLVTLTASNSTNQIQYTTDGSDPTLGGTLVASGSTVSISSTTTLKFAETDGVLFSSVVTEVYTIDTTAPTLNAVHIQSDNANTALAKVGNQVTLTFNASEAIQTPVVTILGHTVSASNTGGNNWQAQYTTVSGDTEGVVPFTIDYTDIAGNAGTQVTATSDASSVTFDKTNPTLSAVHIQSNNANNNLAKVGNVVTLNFTASESIHTPTVTILGHTVTATNIGGNDWSAPYTTVSGDTEGVVPFTVDFTDQAGNAGTQVTATSDASSVTFDKTNPLVAITAPANTATLNHVSAINGTTSDANGVASVTVSIDSGVAQTATISGGTWQLISSVTSNGPHTLDVVSTDNAGNVASTSSSFTIDTTAPNIAVTQPTGGAILNHISAINGTATSSNGITSVDVSINGGAAQNTPVTAGAWSLAVSLSQGSYSVVVSGTDGIGNSATTPATSFIIDTTAPSVAITAPANTATLNHVSAINGTTSDANGVASVTVSIDSGVAQTATISGGTWQLISSVTSNGPHTLDVVSTDNAGNVASTSSSFTIDTTLPTVQASPNGGNFNTAQLVTLTGSKATGTIYYTTDGTLPTLSSASGANPLQINVTATSNVQAFEVDNIGNQGSVASFQFNINSGLPVITLLGSNPQILTLGSTYFESGATAVDSLGGNLTGSIIINSAAVNNTVAGNYSVTYDVTDSFSNHVQKIRTVVVQALVHNFPNGGYASAVPSLAVPSFGGAGTIFHDGLTINGISHDISKFNQDLKKQQFPIGREVQIVVKQAPLYGSSKYQSTTMYLNFGGKDLETYNAGTILSYDVKTGPKIVDPNGFMKNVRIGTTIVDENIVQTHFIFTPAKSMPDTSMILQSVDTYGRVNNAKIHGAIQFGLDAPVVVKQDPNTLTFTDIGQVHQYLDANYYNSPELIAHVHDSASMFGTTGGKVYWTVNISQKTLTVHAIDKDGNPTWTQSSPLEELPMHPRGYGQDVLPHTNTSFAPSWVAGGAYNANAFKMPANMR